MDVVFEKHCGHRIKILRIYKERPLRIGVNQKEPEKTYETFKDNKKNDTFYGVVLIYLK